jgi:hypothetical protein
MPGRRQARCAEIHAVATWRVSHLQGETQQGACGVETGDAHQAQAFRICAKQDVLSVVQQVSVYVNGAGPTAE